MRLPSLRQFEDPDAIFVRSLSYRSTDAHRVETLVKQITELKKEANKREQEKKEMADVVEQDTLIELKGKVTFHVHRTTTAAEHAIVF